MLDETNIERSADRRIPVADKWVGWRPAVALFASNLVSGVYCIDGTVREFGDLGELPVGGGIVYLTNLSGALIGTFYGQRGHLYESDWLRANVAVIFDELGCFCSRSHRESGFSNGRDRDLTFVVPENLDRAAKRLYKVFSHLTGLLGLLYPDLAWARGTEKEYGLKYRLRRLYADHPSIPGKSRQPINQDFAAVLAAASLESEIYGRPVTWWTDSWSWPSLKFQANRVLYGRELLEMALPSPDGWEEIPDFKGADVLSWIDDPDRPMLAEVVIARSPRLSGRIAGLGAGHRNPRRYFSQPELAVMHRLGFEIDFRRVFRGAGFLPPGFLPIGGLGPEVSVCPELSYSLGLLYENLFKARAMAGAPYDDPEARQSHARQGRVSHVPAAGSLARIWIGARDWALSLELACAVFKALTDSPEDRIQPSGFGGGHVMVRFAPTVTGRDFWARMGEFCYATGTVPVGVMSGSQAVATTIPEDLTGLVRHGAEPHTESTRALWTALFSSPDFLLLLDEKAVFDPVGYQGLTRVLRQSALDHGVLSATLAAGRHYSKLEDARAAREEIVN